MVYANTLGYRIVHAMLSVNAILRLSRVQICLLFYAMRNEKSFVLVNLDLIP